jgi:hypothetical protein
VNRPLALCLVLSACAPVTATMEDSHADGYSVALAEGNAQEDHTEVSPGVFLLNSVIASGEVSYVDVANAPPRTDEAASHASADRRRSCYNYDYDYYNDQTRHGSMFGGHTYWYGQAMAEDYHYEGPGPDYSYTRVSSYVYTYADSPVDQLYSMSYVYANGRYVGYTYNVRRNARMSYQYGYWDVRCKSGEISLEARTYHTWMNGATGEEYQYVGNTLDVATECCPEG